jgi:hypothetical protein
VSTGMATLSTGQVAPWPTLTSQSTAATPTLMTQSPGLSEATEVSERPRQHQ